MADEYIKANNIRSILKVAVSKLVKEQPKNARTFLAQSISGARQIDTTRLMLVSSDIPDRTDFLGMVKCLKAQYDSETQTSGELVAIIRALVAAHGKFKSIALASHGPAGSTWVISSKAIIDLADDLANQRTGGGLAVLEALAEAVQTGGRVDLLACNLIASPQGKAFLQDLEKRTGCNFAASVDKTGNPKDATTDWIMESDDVDIRELYFTDTALFDGTFDNGKDNGWSFIAWIEDVAHNTGLDKHVHVVTGGARLMERDGRVSPGVVQGLEKSFSECGLDKIVHLGTGGARAVNLDGSFDPVGMLKCAKALAEFAQNPGAVAVARALAMVYQEIVNNVIEVLKAVDQTAGDVAQRINDLEALSDTCAAIVSDPVGNILELPGLAEQFAALT